MTNKTIQINETFSSYEEFSQALKKFEDQEYVKFSVGTTKLLHLRDFSVAESHMVEQFKLKYRLYECQHAGKKKINDKKSGQRPNTYSKKLGCECHFRIKFDEIRKHLIVTKLDNQHSHSIKKEFYQQNSKVRKPDDQEMKRIVDQVQDGACLTQITRRFNNDNNKNMSNQDIYNYNAKIKSLFFKPKEEAFTELIDELKRDINNTVEASVDSETNICNAVFFMTENQKKWFGSYPEVLHLDGTYDVNNDKYVLFTFLAQDENLNGLPFNLNGFKRKI